MNWNFTCARDANPHYSCSYKNDAICTNACACPKRRLQEKNVSFAVYTRYAPPASLLASLLLSLLLSGVISAARGIKGLIRFLPLCLFIAPCSETRVYCDDVTRNVWTKKKTNKRARETRENVAANNVRAEGEHENALHAARWITFGV